MRETHNIIRDRVALAEFVDWLPVCEKYERYFICLQARKKYMPSLRSVDKTAVKRFTSRREDIVSKIEQLECPVGCYRTKDGEVITDAGLALYITLNPRDMLRATFEGAKALIDMIQKKEGLSDYNPHSEVLSCIHRSKGKSRFVHFDVDRVTGVEVDENAPKTSLSTKEIWDAVVGVVGERAVTLVETRGGCHIMVDPGKVVSVQKNWHPLILKAVKCDQTGDLMVPVVGCSQGGFTPRFFSPEAVISPAGPL